LDAPCRLPAASLDPTIAASAATAIARTVNAVTILIVFVFMSLLLSREEQDRFFIAFVTIHCRFVRDRRHNQVDCRSIAGRLRSPRSTAAADGDSTATECALRSGNRFGAAQRDRRLDQPADMARARSRS
jgi:hypothetical protein